MTNKQKTFTEELLLITNSKIFEFTSLAVDMLPDYFFVVPASSTGKYHPAYALGDGGLVRHVKAAVNIAAVMFGNTTVCGNFNQRHKDLIISALILHDGLKSGLTKASYTVEEHPILVTRYLRQQFDVLHPDKYNEVMNEVFPLIESHMGQWNTNKQGKVILPLPASGPARYVHMCDYLASRKLIDIKFEECTH